MTLIYENLNNYMIFFKQLRKLCQDVFDYENYTFFKTKATIDAIKYCCT